MPWVAPALATAVAVVATAITPALLARLPEPVGDSTKPSYRSLATPGFLIAVFTAVTAAGLAAYALTAPAHWAAWTACVVPCTLAVCIDARTTYLPLPLARAGWVLAALGAVVAALAARDAQLLALSAGGALALGGFFHLVWRLTRSVGYGDVRLMATVGAVTALESWTLPLTAALAGTTLGALVGVGWRVARRRDGAFAYGPPLLVGAFLALAVGETTG